jgi:hypothetical protein
VGAALAAADLSADAAGAGTGKARKKARRQTLMILQYDNGFAGIVTDILHAGPNNSIFHAGQLLRGPTHSGLEIHCSHEKCPLFCAAQKV